MSVRTEVVGRPASPGHTMNTGAAGQGLRVCLLGPQVILRDGDELHAPAPQQRRVLALLASKPGEVVSREWLAQSLWGSATATQLRGLQVYVSNLRSALGKNSIDLVGNGYRLNIDPQAIDEVIFKESLAKGHEFLAQEFYAEAIEHLEHALALWRGEPYDDLPLGEFHARRAGLIEARLAGEDALLRAQVELIRDTQGAEALVPRVAESFAEQPLREGRLMVHLRCLMIAGRMADASARATDYRNRLRAEVGVEPGPAFADFYTKLMRRDPVLLPQAWGSSVSLPSFTTPLIGRDLELDLAINLLKGDSTRLLTLAGVSGVGRTRLAAAIAARLGPTLPGGVIWLESEAAAEADAVLESVARSVGVAGNGAEVRQRLPKLLGRRRTLIVVDGATPGRLKAGLAILLAAGPRVSILVTAPEPVGLASEQVIHLQPFSTTPGSDSSPAARFVSQLLVALTGDEVSTPEQVQALVHGQEGLPPQLEQVAIDLLSGRSA